MFFRSLFPLLTCGQSWLQCQAKIARLMLTSMRPDIGGGGAHLAQGALMSNIIAPLVALHAWQQDAINLASPQPGARAVRCADDTFAPTERIEGMVPS